jgi:preprotein translocase subunit YajC
MYLLNVTFNGGDILFQFIMFILLLGIPAGLIMLFIMIRKRNNHRLDRIEEKLDQLLKGKDQ